MHFSFFLTFFQIQVEYFLCCIVTCSCLCMHVYVVFKCRVISSWDIMIRGHAETSWDTPGPRLCGTERRWGQLSGSSMWHFVMLLLSEWIRPQNHPSVRPGCFILYLDFGLQPSSHSPWDMGYNYCLSVYQLLGLLQYIPLRPIKSHIACCLRLLVFQQFIEEVL